MWVRHTPTSFPRNDILSVDYVIQEMQNTATQRYFLIMNTSTVADTVSAIEEFLVVCILERPSCKAAGDEFFPQTDNIVQGLTAQSAVTVTTMTKLKAMTLASNGAPLVPQY